MARPKSETKRVKVILNLLEEDHERLERVIAARGWDLPPAAGARELLRERMAEVEGRMGLRELEGRILYGNGAGNGKEPITAPAVGPKRPLSDRWDTEDGEMPNLETSAF